MKISRKVCAAMLLGAAALGAGTVKRAIPEAVKKVDSGARSVVVKTVEGAGHTLRTFGKDAGKVAKTTGHDTKIALRAAAGWN